MSSLESQARLADLMFNRHPPCLLNDYSRQGSVLSSIIFHSPAGTRLSSSHPSRLPTHLGANRYRLSTSSAPVHHLLSSTTGSPDNMTRTGGPSNNHNANTRLRPAQRARTYSQSQSRLSSVYRTSVHSSSTTLHLSWLFRSNLPPRRGMPLAVDVQKRSFFGVGEIIGVLANVRTLALYVDSCN